MFCGWFVAVLVFCEVNNMDKSTRSVNAIAETFETTIGDLVEAVTQIALEAGKTQEEGKLAVECGYWHLYRYNPTLENEGKNPFVLDSKEPDWSKFQNFLKGEVRYTSLQKAYPNEAKELFGASENNAKWRYSTYKRLNDMEYTVVK